MKANELRIGNYVLVKYSTRPVEIKELTESDVKLKNGFAEYSQLTPIPLTEEWLVRCGFEYSHRIGSRSFYSIRNLYIEICQDTCAVYYTDKGELICYLKNAHQLQNLYFALTGEELTIKS